MTLRLSRLTALLVAVFLMTGAAAIGFAGPVAARDPASRTTAAEPFGDYVDRLTFDVTAVNPALVTTGGPATITVTGTLTNTGPEAITDPIYRFQRGPALPDSAAVRQEIAEPSEPTDLVQPSFAAVPTPTDRTLVAGESIPFRFTASITDQQGLGVTEPGVYPLMINVNGGVVLPDGPLAARVGELHLLLTVIGVPGSAAPGSTGTGTPARSRPVPVNVVWPVVDQPHLGVGGVFLDEDLLAAIAPDGRLATLVTALTDPAAASLPLGSVTVVLDPQLLDELDRMTRPYRVVADPGGPQPSMNEILQAKQSSAAQSSAAQSSAAQSSAAPNPPRRPAAPPLPAPLRRPPTHRRPPGPGPPPSGSSRPPRCRPVPRPPPRPGPPPGPARPTA